MQQQGPRRGLGAGAGRAPSAWQAALAMTQGMLRAGAALGDGTIPTQRAYGPRPRSRGSNTLRRRGPRGNLGQEEERGPREGSWVSLGNVAPY